MCSYTSPDYPQGFHRHIHISETRTGEGFGMVGEETGDRRNPRREAPDAKRARAPIVNPRPTEHPGDPTRSGSIKPVEITGVFMKTQSHQLA